MIFQHREIMFSRRNLLTAVVAAFVLVLPAACSAENGPERYVAGEHYTALDTPVPTKTGDKIEVIEFFLYGCSHCNAFDPLVDTWKAQLQDDVAFRRVPVTFSGIGPLFAAMFYTADDLGVLEKLHSRLFAAIHEDRRDLTSPEKIRAFFVENGVDGEEFNTSFNSEKVKTQVAQATELMRAYRIEGVPALAVDGKFKVNGRQAGSNDAMLSVTDFLISKVRATK